MVEVDRDLEVVVVADIVAVAADAADRLLTRLNAEKITMTPQKTLNALVVALMLASAPSIHAAEPILTAQTVVQKTFASPGETAQALADAVRANRKSDVLVIVGPSASSWLWSGDEVADRADGEKFIAAYDAKHSLSQLADDKSVLLIGEGDWPFPAPIIRKAGGWRFDTNAGREEIINRRVGLNELNTIQTLLAIVDAQREYAMADLDGNGYHDYAQRILSSEGKRDGLYWPVLKGEPLSPLGPQVADATRQGYGRQLGSGKLAPYHGYKFRMLTAQGKAAMGGAYSYLVGDKMIGGFAAIAYPAKYGVSGVMTFKVSHDGAVYEKNIGKLTERSALRMSSFNPDSSWRKIK